MGLIKALTGATSTALGDQFKEFVNCPTIEKNVLIQRGIVTHGKGNTNPSEGIISNGSTIVVPQGMAMMIIENGEIKEFTADAGTFYFDTSSEPSIFTGGLGKGIIDTFKTIGKRFTYGGQTAKDQRVYYVNLLTITGNKFGSPQPKKITDEKIMSIAPTLIKEFPHVTYILTPSDYNRLGITNMNKVKAILHNKVLFALKSKNYNYDKIVVDQFCFPTKYYEHIKETPNKVTNITFTTHAEDKCLSERF